eukprot:CAMPEP_0118671374 /NCGR_PEP_ID=MMETSP0785-20121206/21967_1 /TAXON_ID=91992 /ORGANISM="Bolidomonas pacifica, Strain CCMP 1866" /LENGTH=87 /DNA_ID=CAMNT_0006566253 /DNA_START=9 /DNA_END=269 /DNA_ORIENTATION=-
MRKNKEAAARKAASGETQPAYKSKMAAAPSPLKSASVPKPSVPKPSYSGVGGGGRGGGGGGGGTSTDARLAAIEAKLDKIMRHLNIP